MGDIQPRIRVEREFLARTMECGSSSSFLEPGNGRPSHTGYAGRSVVIVDNRSDVRDFLASRRARIRPEQAGLRQQLVRPSVQRILDAMTAPPAYVRNGHRDILAANRLGYALYAEAYVDPVRPVNIARFVFLNPRARTFFVNWERAANATVAILRTEAGRNPYDQGLTNLVRGTVHA